MLDLDSIPFLQAKTYGPASGRPIDLLVTHAAAQAPSATGAEGLQKYASTMPDGRVASWHYAVDSDSITQSVRVTDMAWHAPGANYDGIGVELVELYEPSVGDWKTAYSSELLELYAELAAALCKRYSIPPVWLGPADLLAGRRGITTHRAVSLAFRRSTHFDPGVYYPVDRWLPMVKAELDSTSYPPAKDWPNLYLRDGEHAGDPKRPWIARLQKMLDQHPAIRLKPPAGETHDGIFGLQTLAAVKQFQRLAGIWATGNVGPPTWNALKLAVHVQGLHYSGLRRTPIVAKAA